MMERCKQNNTSQRPGNFRTQANTTNSRIMDRQEVAPVPHNRGRLMTGKRGSRYAESFPRQHAPQLTKR